MRKVNQQNTKYTLDAVDLKILEIIQKNARITNIELSNAVGISAPSCLRRIRNLENLEYIKNYNATIDPKKLGFELTIFVLITLSSQEEHNKNEFQTQINKLEEIRECYLLIGETHYIAKIIAYSWEDFQNFLSTKLSKLTCVRKIRSLISSETITNKIGIPIK